MSAPGFAARADALRASDPLVVPHARERALLLLDIEFDRAAESEDYRHAAELARLALILSRG
jgi:hypothetical protein